jgi:hypothetical protein
MVEVFKESKLLSVTFQTNREGQNPKGQAVLIKEIDGKIIRIPVELYRDNAIKTASDNKAIFSQSYHSEPLE